jgi:hypothetical protein
VTAAAVATPGPPAVTAADAADDRDWFATHPRRRYRARRAERGFWIVRRRAGGVFLRIWCVTIPKGLPDSDKALRPLWFDTAWPDLDPLERAELVRHAAREEEAAGA